MSGTGWPSASGRSQALPCRRAVELLFPSETLVEIDRAHLQELVELVLEEVISARDDLVLDDDALLRLELGDQAMGRLGRGDRILLSIDEQARRRAGGEKRKIVMLG